MELSVIQNKIIKIREQKVILDFTLAELYEVENRVLKQAIKRNLDHLTDDFMFRLTKKEVEILRSQNVMSSSHGGTRYLPFAFTEQGFAMLSSVLRSPKAIDVNITIMRTFVFIREYALSHQDLTMKLKEIETKYNKQFKDVYEAINYLLKKDKKEKEQKSRQQIGFKTEKPN